MSRLTPTLRDMLERFERASEGYLLNQTIRDEGHYAISSLQKLNQYGWLKPHKFADPELQHVLAWEMSGDMQNQPGDDTKNQSTL
jgi:hypothetical protein